MKIVHEWLLFHSYLRASDCSVEARRLGEGARSRRHRRPRPAARPRAALVRLRAGGTAGNGVRGTLSTGRKRRPCSGRCWV